MHVLHVCAQVLNALFERRNILFCKLCLRHAAIVFQRTNRRDNDDAVRLEARQTALDVEELLRTEVGAEACFRNAVIAEFQRQARCAHGVAAVRNVCKRTAVHDGRCASNRLHKVRVDGIFEQSRHSAIRLDVLRIDRLAVIRICNEDFAEALFQVFQILCKTQNRHDLACDGDDKAVLARDAVHLATKADDNAAQRTVVHIDAALDEHTALIDAQHVALLHVVIEHGAQQVICRSDGMHVTRKVQVDVLHRQHLCVAAACSAALNAEHRTQRRFTQRDDGLFADLRHSLTEASRCGGLALARRRRVDGRNKDQLAVRLVFKSFEQVIIQLCFKASVGLQLFGTYMQFFRDLRNRS